MKNKNSPPNWNRGFICLYFRFIPIFFSFHYYFHSVRTCVLPKKSLEQMRNAYFALLVFFPPRYFFFIKLLYDFYSSSVAFEVSSGKYLIISLKVKKRAVIKYKKCCDPCFRRNFSLLPNVTFIERNGDSCSFLIMRY